MRRIALALSALVATLAPAAGAWNGTPTIRLVTTTPLVVAGSHFRPAQRVTVTAGTAKRIVRTTSAGLFRADLGAVAFDRCSTAIVAVGVRGDRAAIPARAMCAPAANP
jgi:hypothetical protein